MGVRGLARTPKDWYCLVVMPRRSDDTAQGGKSVESSVTTTNRVPAALSKTRLGRLWALVLGAAVLAALVAWSVEEVSLNYYGPQITTKSAPRAYRLDLRGNSPYGPTRATRAYNQEFTAKAVAVSGGAVGAMFGLAFGLAIGLSGGPSGRSWLRGITASALGGTLGGVAGWLASRSLVPMFYQARADNPGTTLVLVSLLLIRGVPRMIAGMAGGLTLGVALGGGSARLFRGAIGGLIGAGIGVAIVVVGDELISLLVSHSQIAESPILRSPLHRVSAILAVSLPTAAFALWSILSLKLRRDPSPVGQPSS